MEATPSDDTETARSRSERRAEARRQAAEAKAQAERQQAETERIRAEAQRLIEERDRLQADKDADEAAKKAARERYERFVGTQEEIARLRQETRQQIPADLVGQEYVDALIEHNRKVARLEYLETANDLLPTVQQDLRAALTSEIWGAMAAQYDTGATLPDVDTEAYRKAPDVPSALRVLRDSVAAAVEARMQAEIDDLKADLEIERSERAAAQAAAGGRGPQAAAGGTGGGFRSPLTAERYAQMTYEERQQLRSTPEGRAQIDAMTRGRTGFGQQSA